MLVGYDGINNLAVIRQHGTDPLDFQVNATTRALRLTSDGNAAFAGAIAVARTATVTGAWPAGTTTTSNFPNTGLTVGWNLSAGKGEVDLMLGRQAGVGGLNIYSVGPTGALDRAAPILTLDSQGNLSVAGTVSSAAMPAELNLTSFIKPGDPDATAGFNRVIATAQGMNRDVAIHVPAGTYDISGIIAATLSGQQAIFLRGAGSAVTRIRQNADADGIRVVIGNYGPGNFDNGAFNVSGITLDMVCPGSTTKSALVLSATGTGGIAGKPLVVDEIGIVSHSPTSRWNVGLYVERFGNICYISRISVLSANTGISLNGTATDYMASCFMRDCTVIGDGTALVIGPWLQGVHIDNFNSVNTPVCISCLDNVSSAALNLTEEIVISNSYLHGKCIFGPPGANTVLNSIRIAGCYMDVKGMQPGDRHVSFSSVPLVTLVGNYFNGTLGEAVPNIVGLYIEGQSFGTVVTGNTFNAYGVHTDPPTPGTAIQLAANSGGISFSNNVIRDSGSPAVVDAGQRNILVNTMVEGIFYQYGLPDVTPTTPARFYGEIEGHGGLNIYSAGPSGALDSAAPILALDRKGNLTLAPGGTTRLSNQSDIGPSGATIGSNIIFNNGWKYVASDYGWFLRADGAAGVSLNVTATGTAGAPASPIQAWSASPTGVFSIPKAAITSGTGAFSALSVGGNPTMAAFSKAGTPTAVDLPAGQAAVVKDTTGGGVKLYYNDGGTMRSLSLA